MPRRDRYVDLYFEVYGPPPWQCGKLNCDKPILYYGKQGPNFGVIHHIDEDHSNDVIENLVAMHWGCHTSTHTTGRVVSDEGRKNMSAASTLSWANEETKQARLAATQTPEVKVKRREAVAAYWTPENRTEHGDKLREVFKDPAIRAARSERALEYWANVDESVRTRRAQKSSESSAGRQFTEEHLKNLKLAWANVPAVERSERSRKAAASQTPEQRAAKAFKGWETRRIKAKQTEDEK